MWMFRDFAGECDIYESFPIRETQPTFYFSLSGSDNMRSQWAEIVLYIVYLLFSFLNIMLPGFRIADPWRLLYEGFDPYTNRCVLIVTINQNAVYALS